MPSRPRRRGTPSRRADRSASRRGRRLTLIGAGAAALIVLALGAWFAWDALNARAAINRATSDAETVQQALTDGEQDQATSTLEDLQRNTTDAREHTDGPLWALAGAMPWVGDSVDAVRVASVAIDDIAQDALPPIMSVSSGLNAQIFSPSDGRFPLQEFAELTGPVTEAAGVLRSTRERVDAIDADSLLDLVSGQMADLQDKVGTAESAASGAATALRLAPQMLGADGPRTYVLLFQNNAESRATGGIPGAASIIRAENGALTFERQFNVSDLNDFDEPVIELTEDERLTFGTAVAEDLRDVTLTPDFPRTAQITRAMVQESFGTDVDGVLSVDPVALGYLLRGTGSITLEDDTELTADNAADELLNGVYRRYPDGSQQDLFFASAAQQIFTRILSGAGDATETIAGLSDAERERRLMLWSANEEVQAELAGTRLSGALPEPSANPRVGVYISDAAASKMQYYLSWRTTVAAWECTDEDAQTLAVTTTFNAATPDNVRDLPTYITGDGSRVDRGSQRINLRMFAPSGGTVTAMYVNGVKKTYGIGQSGDRPVLVTPLEIGPREQVEIRVEMTAGEDQPGDTIVTSTPGARPMEQDVAFPTACGG